MLRQLFWIIILTLVTVSIHGLYTASLLWRWQKFKAKHRSVHNTVRHYLFILGKMVIMLLLMHFAEAIAWAVFYVASNGMPDLESALYFSLTSYTTIGYGDLLLPKDLRIIGASEGLIGTFMSGWSVAVVVALLHSIIPDKGAAAKPDC